MNPIKYFSMFSGIGGFEYGMEQSNIDFQCVGFCEVDKYAESIYSRHFPEHRNFGDATEIRTEELSDFDFLVGGFPCQAFSHAGLRRGFDDTRGTLFFEIARILKDKRPRYFLLENVRGLLHHNKGKTFKTILKVLTDLGYNVKWEVLNSKDFGVPQRRERIFIKGYSRGRCGGEVLSLRNCYEKSVGKLKCINPHKHQAQQVYEIDGLSACLSANGGGQGGKTGLYRIPSDKLDVGNEYIEQNFTKVNEKQCVTTSKEGDSYAITTRNRESPLHKKQYNYVLEFFDDSVVDKDDDDNPTLRIRETTKKGYKEAYPDDGVLLDRAGRKIAKGLVHKGATGTLKTQPAWGTVTQDYRIRKLTPKECERLQAFPDDWTRFGVNGEEISDTQRYKCCGNAVTTSVITAIVNDMFDEIYEEK